MECFHVHLRVFFLSSEGNMTATSAPESWRNDSLAFDATAGNGTSALTPVMPPAISKAISVTLVVNLVVTMASLGSTMDVSKIKVRRRVRHHADLGCAIINNLCVLPPRVTS